MNRSKADDSYTKERLEEITGFVESAMGWYEDFRSLPKDSVLKLMKLGSKVQKFLVRKS